MIVRQTSSPSFISFTDELTDDLRKAKRFGTARWYEGSLSVLKDFINGTDRHANNGKAKGNKSDKYKGKDLTFAEINYTFLTKFETRHFENGNGANGLSVYMRAIRAIYNKGIDAKLAKKEDYPFDSYKIPGEQTRKLALDWPLMQKMLSSKINGDNECFDARNYFIASYMMYGMSYIDLAFLRKADIVNGRIQYRRAKSSRLYDIKVTPALHEILTFYSNRNVGSDFIFPIIKREAPVQQDADYIYGRRVYNKRLKSLASQCYIPFELIKNITSRTIRHSFATHARLTGVPVDVIKEMLGHSTIRTTEIYLNSLPKHTLDDYNAQVMNGKAFQSK